MWRRRHSESMERVLAGAGRPEDRAAVNAFEALSEAQSPRPDAAFKSDKREALLKGMAERVRMAPRQARSDAIVVRPKLSRSAVIKRVVLVPAIILALFVVFTGGAYAMSAGSNPDSGLYGTKLFFEGIRESLTGSAEAKALLELDYTRERIEEMRYLTSHNVGRGADRCASAYADNLAAAQSRITQLSGEAFDQASAEFLDVTGDQLASLDGFAAEASGTLAPAMEQARQACNGAMQGMRNNQQMRMGPGGGTQSQPGGGSDGSGGKGGDGTMPGNGTQNGGGSGGSMMSPETSGGSMSGSGGMPGSGMP